MAAESCRRIDADDSNWTARECSAGGLRRPRNGPKQAGTAGAKHAASPCAEPGDAPRPARDALEQAAEVDGGDEWGQGRMGTGSLTQDHTIGWILARIFFCGTGQRTRHTGRVPLRLGSEGPTGGGMSEGGIAGSGLWRRRNHSGGIMPAD